MGLAYKKGGFPPTVTSLKNRSMNGKHDRGIRECVFSSGGMIYAINTRGLGNGGRGFNYVHDFISFMDNSMMSSYRDLYTVSMNGFCGDSRSSRSPNLGYAGEGKHPGHVESVLN